jgi:hypothetical protein
LTAGTLMTAAVILAGCGESGSSGTEAPASSAAGNGCAPVAGDKLVVLTDDKNLQNTDNIVPAINKKASSPQLIAALDKVSAALDTTKLIELNKAVDIDRKSSKAAAEEFATANSITTGIEKGPGGDLTVGAANFSENATLGELYNIALTAAGYKVKVQQIGNRELYEPALEKGDIDVVPEYAATLATFLSGKVDGKDAKDPSSPPSTASRPCPNWPPSARARRPSWVVRRSARSGPSASRASSTPTSSRRASSARSTRAARSPRPASSRAPSASAWSSARTAHWPPADTSRSARSNHPGCGASRERCPASARFVTGAALGSICDHA